ncbi:NUDIX domain-containing protein [Robertkochia flava]|uniref:NUDIX domain-containing protein n=1 Tax=Robertkochia flava TaxID=3447986 RepID=UPI001CCA765A|nr:NUDIX domain-containing protein [Robertkochia marina]
MILRLKDVNVETLSDAWYTLKRYTFTWKTFKGAWQRQSREVYDRGNGVAVLMHNSHTGKVLLVRQFRMPTYINGNPTGLLLEVPAGVLDTDNPEECMIREIREETGYTVPTVTRLFEAYTSPGAVTENLHFFYCDYAGALKTDEGGGSTEETEDLLVEEYPVTAIKNMLTRSEIKDAKTLLLLQYGFLKGLI